jgi:hypothetical protein
MRSARLLMQKLRGSRAAVHARISAFARRAYDRSAAPAAVRIGVGDVALPVDSIRVGESVLGHGGLQLVAGLALLIAHAFDRTPGLLRYRVRFACMRDHWTGEMGPRPMTVEGLWPFVLHHVLWHWQWAKEWCVHSGFLDNKAEGAQLFWRWDYQNARLAKWIRDFERQEWESKRARASARWGEGAG